VHSLRRGAAEALELIAHGDSKSSKVVGRCIGEIELPKGATIGAIVRGRQPAGKSGNGKTNGRNYQVIIAHHDIAIEPDDHVIVFAVNRRTVPKVEKLFQVDPGFF
jgi:trk system potassium uptake protein